MAKIIDDNIILKTKECSKEFECLRADDHACLKTKVDRFISGNVLFIDCNDKFCHYYMNFGNSVICNCPIRKEVFRKYHF